MPWSGKFSWCALLIMCWTAAVLFPTETIFHPETTFGATEKFNFERNVSATTAESLPDTTSITSTTTTSATTMLPPTATPFGANPDGVAVCIAGNLRTFTASNVFPHIRPFHEKLWRSNISFFFQGTLEGAGPKNQTGHNLAAIHETNQTALKMALTSLRPEAVKLVENAEDVTEENIAQYVLHQECFRDIEYKYGVAFFADRQHFLRGLNQLTHVISSLEMMMRFEEARGQRFKAVVLTRPDLRYDVNRSDHDWFRDVAWVPKWISNGGVALKMDFWVAMPRKLAERFYLLGKVLSCGPSDKCCRKFDKPESLWEYFTGAVHGPKSCKCANISTAWKKSRVGKIQRAFDT